MLGQNGKTRSGIAPLGSASNRPCRRPVIDDDDASLNADAESLVVLLHGVGARGADLAPLGRAWRKALPTAAFASPDAPDPYDQGEFGRQWYSLAGVTATNRPARVAAARAGFDRTIERAIERRGFAGRLDRVALVGFSQGATMALDAVASDRWPVAAVVALSGRFATAEPSAAANRIPVLIVHGSADPVIPAAEADHAAALLESLGFAVRKHILANVGHAVAPKAAALAGAFLAKILTP